MHGTYRAQEWGTDFHFYTSIGDIEALVESFPEYESFRYEPLRPQPYRAGLKLLPCLLVCAVASPQFQYEAQAPSEVPRDPARPASAGVGLKQSPASSEELQSATPAPPIAAAARAQPTPKMFPSPRSAGDLEMPIVTKPVAMPVPDPMGIDIASLPKPDLALLVHVNQGAKQALPVASGDRLIGELEFSDEGQVVSVRLGSLLDLVQDRFEADEFDRLSRSPAVMDFVPVDALAAMGIDISYDPVYDEFQLDMPELAQSQRPSEYS